MMFIKFNAKKTSPFYILMLLYEKINKINDNQHNKKVLDHK